MACPCNSCAVGHKGEVHDITKYMLPVWGEENLKSLATEIDRELDRRKNAFEPGDEVTHNSLVQFRGLRGTVIKPHHTMPTTGDKGPLFWVLWPKNYTLQGHYGENLTLVSRRR
jgi:hypothetical protein